MAKVLDNTQSVDQYIVTHPDINFVGDAITPWHANSIDAAIFMLESQGVRVNALVVLRPHPVTGWAVKPSHFVSPSITFVIQESAQSETNQESACKPTEKPMPLARPSLMQRINAAVWSYLYFLVFDNKHFSHRPLLVYSNPCYLSIHQSMHYYGLGRHVEMMTTDEGVATYMNTLPEYEKTPTTNSALTEARHHLRYDIIGYHVSRLLHGFHSTRILKKCRGRWMPNTQVAPFYRQVFRESLKSVSITVDPDLIRSSVLICTTAWNRDDVKAEEDYVKLMDVCRALKSQGYNLLLKTHPRDKFFISKCSELCCTLLDISGVSMECICEYAQPKAIISYSSTVLVTGKLFWNIPVCCISDLLCRANISPVYLKEIDAFKTTFGRMIPFAQNTNQVIEILSK